MGDNVFRRTENPNIWLDINLTTTTTIFLSQFLLTSQLFGYGPWFQQRYIQYEHSLANCICAPFLFYFFWSIGNSISRYICDVVGINHKQYLKCIAYTSTALISGGFIVSALNPSNVNFNFCFGIMGGLGTSFYLTYMNYCFYDNFQSKPALLISICHIGRAMGLLCMPFVIQYLLRWQSLENALLINGALLLHAIPLLMLCEMNNSKGRIKNHYIPSVDNLYRYRSTSRMVFDNELTEYNNQQNNFENALSFNSRNWKSPSDISNTEDATSLSSVTVNDIEENYNNNKTETNEHNILDDDNTKLATHNRYKNALGVEIMPEILEAEEEEEEEEEESSEEGGFGKGKAMCTRRISLKRLSAISIKLEELMTKERAENGNKPENQAQRRSNNVFENTIESLSSLNEHELSDENQLHRSSFLKEIGKSESTCQCCMPYRKYLLKRRVRFTCKRIFYFFVQPIASACTVIDFYPCLLSKTTESLGSVTIFCTLPYFATNYFRNEKATMTDSLILLCLVAFCWLFFTIIAMLGMHRLSKRKIKLLYILGTILSGLVTLFFTTAKQFHLLALYALIYGLSYGITSLCGDAVFKETLGVRNYPESESALEIISALLLYPIFYVVYYITDDIKKWYFILSILNFTTSALWIIFSSIKFLYNYRRYSSPIIE